MHGSLQEACATIESFLSSRSCHRTVPKRGRIHPSVGGVEGADAIPPHRMVEGAQTLRQGAWVSCCPPEQKGVPCSWMCHLLASKHCVRAAAALDNVANLVTPSPSTKSSVSMQAQEHQSDSKIAAISILFTIIHGFHPCRQSPLRHGWHGEARWSRLCS
jgi:hypothetical protein